MKKLSARTWICFVLIGLVGQFSWTIENMYLNVYLYNTISQNTSSIATMVACSAITATLTTLVMGVVSDRVGKRKPFIVIGYLLWGVSVAAFGFVTTKSPGVAAAAAGMIDDVCDPAQTRKYVIAALEMLSSKRDSNPPKKHGNLPL